MNEVVKRLKELDMAENGDGDDVEGMWFFFENIMKAAKVM